jgi:hypothetical protein
MDPPQLDEVAENDKTLVENVLYAIMTCKHPEKFFSSWAVSCTATTYMVAANMPDENFDLNMSDLQAIHSVSPLRIASISVANTNGKNKLLVKVLNEKQKVQLSETEITVTRKRKSTWFF